MFRPLPAVRSERSNIKIQNTLNPFLLEPDFQSLLTQIHIVAQT